jgi:hypothetical protein
MRGILALSEQMIINSIIDSIVPFVAKSKAGSAFIILSSSVLCLSLIFLIFGGYLWLSNDYGYDGAALIMGGVLVALSIIMAGAGFAYLKYKEREFERVKESIFQNLMSFLDESNEELGALVEKNPKAALLISSTIGLILGKRLL